MLEPHARRRAREAARTAEARDAADVLRRAIAYAVLAPSTYNTQPWVFHLARHDQIDLYADRSRSLPVVDPKGRELTASCGAALFSLRLGLRHLGLDGEVEPVPVPDDPDLLARVRTRPGAAESGLEQQLFEAISLRRSAQGTFTTRHIAPALQSELWAAVEAEGAWVERITDEARRIAIADLVFSAVREQAEDPRFRAELAAWVHPSTSTRRDGLRGDSLGFGPLRSLFAPLWLRTTDWGPGYSVGVRRHVMDAPLLVVLGTPGDSPRDWLAAGQALDHLLLRAAAEGIFASYFNAPLQREAQRTRLTELLGRGAPQVVLALGYGSPGPSTHRRPLSEVVY
jgi:nitroreductase